MVKKGIILLGVALMFGQLFCVTEAARPSNFHERKAGTAQNPYQISDITNLRWLSENQKVWGKPERVIRFLNIELWRFSAKSYYFVQTADIDASETEFWNEGNGFSPIGFRKMDTSKGSDNIIASYFYGSYDGNNNAIRNLFINKNIDSAFDRESVGLFGAVSGATLKNIHLQNVSLQIVTETDQLQRADVGSIVGVMIEESTIKHCVVDGIVSVENGTSVGGIVGWSFDSKVLKCASMVRINAQNSLFVGGIVGWIVKSDINDSYFIGAISGNSFVENWTGGIVGRGLPLNSIHSPSESVPWLSRITNVYSVVQTDSEKVYGLFGQLDYSYISNSFWDAEVSGIHTAFNDKDNSRSINISGFSTSTLKQELTFTNAGWDFENVWALDSNKNNGFPHLKN